MSFSTDTLRGRFEAEQGPAYTNRWMVEMPPISGSTPGGAAVDVSALATPLSELCTAVRIPGKSLNTLDRQLGMEPIKVASGYNVDVLSMTFYLTHTYSARKYFQGWMDLCINPTAPYTAGFYDNYVHPITVKQQDRQGNDIYSAKILNCFPLSINEIELNNQAVGAVGELTVTLQYSQLEVQ